MSVAKSLAIEKESERDNVPMLIPQIKSTKKNPGLCPRLEKAREFVERVICLEKQSGGVSA